MQDRGTENLRNRVIVSLHDVMPETMDRIRYILELLASREIRPVELLVVPGRDWQPRQLEELYQWQAQGHRLVAHGWIHQASDFRGIRRRLHAAFLSRNAAEHLALTSTGIRQLMERSAAWFREHGFDIPSLYVPPAWALGPLKACDRRRLPYERIEVLRGYMNVSSGKIERGGLVGYEVDNWWRYRFVKAWNQYQIRISRRRDRSLRMAIHPCDFELSAARDLWRDLAWLEEE